jgi:hypothetical protein
VGGGDCLAWLGGGGIGLPDSRESLSNLNKNNTLDASQYLNSYIRDNDNVSQFFETNLKSEYYDTQSIINKYKNTNRPLVLSINIHCP